jgi:tRNA (guanine-N7-)-methyltransferase
MSRALRYDIPGSDWRVCEEDVRAKGWSEVFARDVDSAPPLVVEIGFGRGEFLLDLAARAPRVAHVGVEYSFKRVLKVARRLARTPLRNVRLLEVRAEQLVEELLPAESVSVFWINFPDPWPKKRHARRRLLQPAFVRAMAHRLAPEGRLEVATDDPAYAEEIDRALAGEPALENALAPERFLREVAGRTPTAYELEWRAEGRSLHFWTYRRTSRTLPG